MIAKYLDEATLLYKGNIDTLISVMQKLHGTILPGIIGRLNEIQYWFCKEFYYRPYKMNGSLICISYLNISRNGMAVWKIYLYGRYENGDVRSMERNIGKPFSADDKAAMKVSEAYMRRSMLGLMKKPDHERMYSAVVSLYSDILNHDWSKGN